MVDTHYRGQFSTSDGSYLILLLVSSCGKASVSSARAPRASDSRSVSALDERVALEALEVKRGLAAFTSLSIAAPADRKAIRLPQHLFKLYTGLRITEWACESVCVCV